MSKIDELPGVELDIAVARALGWKPAIIGWEKNGYWNDEEKPWYISDDRDPVYIGNRLATFSPHSNIAQAFELDGPLWIWSFREDHYGNIRVSVEITRVSNCYAYREYLAEIYVERNRKSKVETYATARCLAWLKAMAAKEGDNNV